MPRHYGPRPTGEKGRSLTHLQFTPINRLPSDLPAMPEDGSSDGSGHFIKKTGWHRGKSLTGKQGQRIRAFKVDVKGGRVFMIPYAELQNDAWGQVRHHSNSTPSSVPATNTHPPPNSKSPPTRMPTQPSFLKSTPSPSTTTPSGPGTSPSSPSKT
ncbi:hypothetical protein BCR34DRAFT_554508 [Clohesyomyces aquaticus]|uniref:Uncharacterized protein n=1 Tax=Clohesyomyces aquaticus TaxID=1231657 RepID=A0A1Y2A7A3_9PLEO|nr:hypothetical protein BCR34DRAFT_554508 [Clohesyomyces aquaticus]